MVINNHSRDGAFAQLVITTVSHSERVMLIDLLLRHTSEPPVMLANGAICITAISTEIDAIKTELAGLVARPVAYDQIASNWSYRMLLPFGVIAPAIVMQAGKRHELLTYGRSVQITLDDLALFGNHLLGHEGSPGRFAYYRVVNSRVRSFARSTDDLVAFV